MRSRYTAYVRHDIDYLFATHDPETATDVDRDATARWAEESTWLGLQVLDVVGGGAGDQHGEVEFVARWRADRQDHRHHERATFRRHEGRWVFTTGVTPKRVPVRAAAKPGPNAPCPCNSGKKYKRCCGA
jgi:SEC-C motif-containing protein